MPLRRRQIHQPTLRQQQQLSPVRRPVRRHMRPRLPSLLRHRLQSLQIHLVVEVPRIRQNRPRTHPLQMRRIDHMDVPRRRHKQVADFGCFEHRRHPKTVHHRLQRPQRRDLRHDHLRPQPPRPRRHPAPAPPVARHHRHLPRQQQIRRPNHPVQRALPRPVPIVEHVLRRRVVHRDDRIPQRPLRRHRPQPNHPRRRLLAAPDHAVQQLLPIPVQRRNQIRPVVHRDLRTRVQHPPDVFVVLLIALPLNREHRHPRALYQRRRHLILRRKRIARAQRHLRPAALQRQRQIRRLRGHMQTRPNPHALQRTLPREPLPNLRDHRHLPRRPRNPLLAGVGQPRIPNVRLNAHRSTISSAPPPRRRASQRRAQVCIPPARRLALASTISPIFS